VLAPPTRIPLNTLAIGFGTAGLADLWSTAGGVLGIPTGVGVAFWVIAAIVWVWLIVAHVVRGVRSAESLASQLRNPVQGPLAALIPIVGMLLGDELYQSAPVAGRVLFLASLLVTVVFASWILAFWMRGGLAIDAIHGGYFLPTVAGGLVAATAAADIGMTDLAIASFAVGVFFWVVMFLAIFARIALRPALPGPLRPTLAIFLAPPAVAGGAWFSIDRHTSDPVALGLAGLTVVMLLMLVVIAPTFRKLAFSLGFWSFTFPLAATARLGVDWLAITRPAGWQVGVVTLVTVITALIVTIAIASLRLRLRASARADQQPTTAAADESVA
jgi:tellurite resistance protein